MPFEHEQKFVLDLNTSPDWIERLPGVRRTSTDDITQIYMDDGVRLRKAVRSGQDIRSGAAPSTTYTLTYKRRTRGGTIEIETLVEQDDYARLEPLAERSIKKTRSSFTHEDSGLILELDIFRDAAGSIYLAKLEVEYDLDEHHKLDAIEEMLMSKLVLRVGDDDKRWSNHKLAEHYYALGLCGEVYGTDFRDTFGLPDLEPAGANF